MAEESYITSSEPPRMINAMSEGINSLLNIFEQSTRSFNAMGDAMQSKMITCLAEDILIKSGAVAPESTTTVNRSSPRFANKKQSDVAVNATNMSKQSHWGPTSNHGPVASFEWITNGMNKQPGLEQTTSPKLDHLAVQAVSQVKLTSGQLKSVNINLGTFGFGITMFRGQ
ncbi:hypothetical protein HN011_001042, partial [Eciton burchellii]